MKIRVSYRLISSALPEGSERGKVQKKCVLNDDEIDTGWANYDVNKLRFARKLAPSTIKTNIFCWGHQDWMINNKRQTPCNFASCGAQKMFCYRDFRAAALKARQGRSILICRFERHRSILTPLKQTLQLPMPNYTAVFRKCFNNHCFKLKVEIRLLLHVLCVVFEQMLHSFP